ncbi:hypothetical protein D9M71_835570 [compost metagenome]
MYGPALVRQAVLNALVVLALYEDQVARADIPNGEAKGFQERGRAPLQGSVTSCTYIPGGSPFFVQESVIGPSQHPCQVLPQRITAFPAGIEAQVIDLTGMKCFVAAVKHASW